LSDLVKATYRSSSGGPRCGVSVAVRALRIIKSARTVMRSSSECSPTLGKPDSPVRRSAPCRPRYCFPGRFSARRTALVIVEGSVYAGRYLDSRRFAGGLRTLPERLIPILCQGDRDAQVSDRLRQQTAIRFYAFPCEIRLKTLRYGYFEFFIANFSVPVNPNEASGFFSRTAIDAPNYTKGKALRYVKQDGSPARPHGFGGCVSQGKPWPTGAKKHATPQACKRGVF
jgi:hypothetical protein